MKQWGALGSVFVWILSNFGGLMARETLAREIPKEPIQWVTIQDEKSQIKIDFPQEPLEMSFDIPFQNTPPKGTVHLYSVPTSSGLIVLSTYHAQEISPNWFNQEKLTQFFDQILVPHFFYYPKVFHAEQLLEFTPTVIDQYPGAAFQITYLDHEIEKKLKGYSFVYNHFLCVYFYLSSAHDFNEAILNHLHHSLKIPEPKLLEK